jgi:hypothetical protein
MLLLLVLVLIMEALLPDEYQLEVLVWFDYLRLAL